MLYETTRFVSPQFSQFDGIISTQTPASHVSGHFVSQNSIMACDC